MILLATSLIFFIITMVVVAAGWGVTCKNFKNSSLFSCTGYQSDDAPHGAEFIAAAVSHNQNISHLSFS